MTKKFLINVTPILLDEDGEINQNVDPSDFSFNLDVDDSTTPFIAIRDALQVGLINQPGVKSFGGWCT